MLKFKLEHILVVFTSWLIIKYIWSCNIHGKIIKIQTRHRNMANNNNNNSEKKSSTLETPIPMTDISIYKNILVVGETGTGKSSLISACCGQDKYESGASIKISDSLNGQTSKILETMINENLKFRFFDTMGFAGASDPNSTKTTASHFMVVKNTLVSLLSSSQKFSAIIFVQNGRLTDHFEHIYDFFTKILFQNSKIPKIIMKTHCELSTPDPFSWWTSAEIKNLTDRKLIFDHHLSGTFSSSMFTGIPDLVGGSAESLLSCIKNFPKDNLFSAFEGKIHVLDLLVIVWNWFIVSFKLSPLLCVLKVSELDIVEKLHNAKLTSSDILNIKNCLKISFNQKPKVEVSKKIN